MQWNLFIGVMFRWVPLVTHPMLIFGYKYRELFPLLLIFVGALGEVRFGVFGRKLSRGKFSKFSPFVCFCCVLHVLVHVHIYFCDVDE